MKKQLEKIKIQLEALAPEDESRFTCAANLVHTARAIAIANNHPHTTAAGIRVDQLAPSTAIEILSSLIGSCPVESSDTLSVADVCDLLKVSPATVAGWIETRQLRASNINSGDRPRWIIQRKELDAFLEFRKF